MPPVRFRFGRGIEKIASIVIDAVPSEAEVREFEVSNFPLESGQTASDRHIIERPLTIEVEGILTNVPVFPYYLKDSIKRQLAFAPIPTVSPDGIVSGLVSLTEAEGQTPLSPAEEKLEALREVASKREPITIEIGLDVYESMVITRLEAVRNQQSGEGIFIRVSAQQVKIITAATAPVGTVVVRQARQPAVPKVQDTGKPPEASPPSFTTPIPKDFASAAQTTTTGPPVAPPP
jgi:hypothetical protein